MLDVEVMRSEREKLPDQVSVLIGWTQEKKKNNFPEDEKCSKSEGFTDFSCKIILGFFMFKNIVMLEIIYGLLLTYDTID